jgi:hypothetical protein
MFCRRDEGHDERSVFFVIRDAFLFSFVSSVVIMHHDASAPSFHVCSSQLPIFLSTDIDQLNESCLIDQISPSNECSEENLEARETLKYALASQINLAIDDWRSSTKDRDTSTSSSETLEDHSFDHFVDYRAFGEYESH